MDQGVRVVLSMGIVTGGMVLALLFRHPSPPPNAPTADPCGPLVLRGRMATPSAELSDLPSVRVGVKRPPVDTSPTSLVPARASLDATEPPPLLARSYPESPETATSRWGTSMAFGLAGAETEALHERTHKIVDGDTLAKLAQRFLGSADRAREIYEANKYLLPGPEILPIGVELTIPPRRNPAATAPGVVSEAPLVPIPPRPLRQ
jgi:phage tail protein X